MKLPDLINVGTALVAASTTTLPDVLINMRTYGLTNRMIKAVRPLFEPTAPPPLTFKQHISAVLNAGPGTTPLDPTSYGGKFLGSRMRTLLAATLLKPDSYVWVCAAHSHRLWNSAAYVLGIGIRCKRAHGAMLLWRTQ